MGVDEKLEAMVDELLRIEGLSRDTVHNRLEVVGRRRALLEERLSPPEPYRPPSRAELEAELERLRAERMSFDVHDSPGERLPPDPTRQRMVALR